MRYVHISDIAKHAGLEVTIAGWLYNLRSVGRKKLLLIRDGTGLLQGTITPQAVDPEVLEQCERLTQESSLVISGSVIEEPKSPGGYELQVKRLSILNRADTYPIITEGHGPDFLMDNRHLWIRSARQTAILRIRASVTRECRRFFDGLGFTEIAAPIFTPTICEGLDTAFETEYFEEKIYLSQSGQLYNEAGAMALGKVYSVGPAFRALKSRTRKHLLEFWMVEPEIAFAELDDVMDLSEQLVCQIVRQVLQTNREDLQTLKRDLTPLEGLKQPFHRIRYKEAVRLLAEAGAPVEEQQQEWSGEQIKALVGLFDRPLFVHHFPAERKPFYAKPDAKDKRYCLSAELLTQGSESVLVNGGQRDEDLKALARRFDQQGQRRETVEWYLDLRRFGSVPHSGFGMHIEELVAWLCQAKHIREAITFPRMYQRIYP